MLVLGRKKDESVLIGNDIRVMVVEVERGQVRLGIEAPQDVRILREELTEKPAK